MIVSVALFPVGAIWWTLIAVARWRRPSGSDDGLRKRFGQALFGAWVGLAVLVPPTLAWVWADRVDWLRF